VRAVKHAEAGAESKYLAGQGVARFLVACAAGVREGVKVLLTGRCAGQGGGGSRRQRGGWELPRLPRL
jgi:hypothetical protein